MAKKRRSADNQDNSDENTASRRYAHIFRPGLLLRPLAINGEAKLKKPKRKWIVLAAILLIMAALATAYMVRSRSVRQEAKQTEQAKQQETELFISQSRPIAESLVAEVEKIHQNNFLQLGNTTKNYEEAKTALAQRISDLQSSKANVAKYESEFRQLKPNANNKDLADRINRTFELANTIIRKYEASLTLRDKTLQAYSEPLSELTKYSESASRGEERSVLITQTDKIVSVAQAAHDNISKLSAAPDDKPLHDLRTDYLIDIKTTFAKLNSYYRDYQPELITAELEQFNSRNVQRNETVAKVTQDYITNSSIAQDFAAFKQAAASL